MEAGERGTHPRTGKAAPMWTCPSGQVGVGGGARGPGAPSPVFKSETRRLTSGPRSSSEEEVFFRQPGKHTERHRTPLLRTRLVGGCHPQVGGSSGAPAGGSRPGLLRPFARGCPGEPAVGAPSLLPRNPLRFAAAPARRSAGPGAPAPLCALHPPPLSPSFHRCPALLAPGSVRAPLLRPLLVAGCDEKRPFYTRRAQQHYRHTDPFVANN